MPKQRKIKRYHKSVWNGRSRPGGLAVFAWVAVFSVLVFVGISIYRPVYDLLTGNLALPGRSSSQPEEPIESEPEPPAEPEPQPQPGPEPERQPLRAVYLPYATAVDPAGLVSFLDALEGTEINAVLVDIKDERGQVLFSTQNSDATRWGVVSERPLDLRELAAALGERGMQLAVRMHAFRDEAAARANRDMAIHYQNTEMLWLDNAPNAGGKPWLNPYSGSAKSYLAGLAGEAVEQGAVLVVLDSVLFPDNSNMGTAGFGTGAAGSRGDALHAFMDEITGVIKEKGARAAAYLPAAPLSEELSGMRYGGDPLLITGDTVATGALPYQIGSSFVGQGLTAAQAIQNPAAAVRTALESVRLRLNADASRREQPQVIPLLQGGNESAYNAAAPYTAGEIRAQIDAAAALGMEEYILYQTAGSYLLR